MYASNRSRMLCFKIANPRDGLPSEPIQIRIVSDSEWDRGSVFRKHDSPPAPDIQKWQGEELATPNSVHCASPNGSSLVLAAESESFLNARVQKLELIAERLLVN
jgi:hypothetical protein